ncbi:hypothetical protein [Cohnella sp. GCM10027633]|uniref:hypothetical protein n=1 Tax=unclassified Cohnella TaxID=2636738 RepID=UPI003641768B
MKSNRTEIEEDILEKCKQLVLELRGNKAGSGNALLNFELINQLYDRLIQYKKQINDKEIVNKEVVGVLFYTCSRFYVQSNYANNREELLNQFSKLNLVLLKLYMTLDE